MAQLDRPENAPIEFRAIIERNLLNMPAIFTDTRRLHPEPCVYAGKTTALHPSRHDPFQRLQYQPDRRKLAYTLSLVRDRGRESAKRPPGLTASGCCQGR
ncbi:hypothetical protein MARHY1750 [Marinobacter nauticus ATCC 49840]|nr:hypothetical protein MARHY1750 [Marinobacter nauticus ATCC 49840]